MSPTHTELSDLQAIFWDFDGVLLNSNEIRDKGFAEVLKEYPAAEVDQLLAFHQQNGGLSRYVKFRYFFEKIRGVSISESEIQQWAERFSVIMRELLTDSGLQIQETINYVRRNHTRVHMYIVSGSDQEELRFLCKAHGIASYFKRIHGSPTPKKEWVGTILKEEKLESGKCILVGDSINDHEAASVNGMHFMSYNGTEELDSKTTFILDLNY
ncbi:Phosphoglycolate phosphatase, HAD superfamily [Cyclonatronum proteinivorum]|uniref:phosphoglycolate phosphatase n=1 Tax=Cyclonatronum proteinivorum TaxID=1457365 RepID=A0A345UMJ2_9BACT|nr:HAD hydrolase-like protein [Cyclonatronum proteinivorum]AXJ01694.1 Phosphoglycolate phosphatase, HAD superfamily [Cyclonatronum proteinivorum]